MLAKVFYDTDHHFQYEIRSMKGDIDVTNVDPRGPNPKELLLAALCGCTGTDMVDLMKKFGVIYESFSLSAGASLTDRHPKHFASIELSYFVRGVGIDITDVVEAANRSMHQYSGTAAMLSKACPITYKVHINDVVVASGEAAFATY